MTRAAKSELRRAHGGLGRGPNGPPQGSGAPAPIHLRPTAPLAERALLPGDPGRALALAQVLIEQPRMFNHHRGLWGYSGPARADGQQLTIQSTGMGGPSAAIVFEELIALGVRRAIRVGTCGALVSDLELGDLVLATEAIAGDGASRALGAGERVLADPRLVSALSDAASTARSGAVLSTDLFYEPATPPAASSGADGASAAGGALVADDALPAGGAVAADGAVATGGALMADGAVAADHALMVAGAVATDGAVAVEMESATLFALGIRHEVAVGCLLAVSDVFPAPGVRRRIADDALLAAAERMGAAAVAALGG